MKLYQVHINLFITGFVAIISASCNNQPRPTTYTSEKVNDMDSINHGYNELANPNELDLFPISDYNSDNQEVKNVDRPNISTLKTDLDTTLLFGVWTSDPNGPHADFMLSSDSFYVVDYDGDGSMPYNLIGHNMKIYYNDFIQEGEVTYISQDTLSIIWKHFEKVNNYVRWTQ